MKMYEIRAAFVPGKPLTRVQRTSSLFREEPVVLGKTLRRNSPRYTITEETFKANEDHLRRLEKAEAIIIRPVLVEEGPFPENWNPLKDMDSVVKDRSLSLEEFVEKMAPVAERFGKTREDLENVARQYFKNRELADQLRAKAEVEATAKEGQPPVDLKELHKELDKHPRQGPPVEMYDEGDEDEGENVPMEPPEVTETVVENVPRSPVAPINTQLLPPASLTTTPGPMAQAPVSALVELMAPPPAATHQEPSVEEARAQDRQAPTPVKE